MVWIYAEGRAAGQRSRLWCVAFTADAAWGSPSICHISSTFTHTPASTASMEDYFSHGIRILKKKLLKVANSKFCVYISQHWVFLLILNFSQNSKYFPRTLNFSQNSFLRIFFLKILKKKKFLELWLIFLRILTFLLRILISCISDFFLVILFAIARYKNHNSEEKL